MRRLHAGTARGPRGSVGAARWAWVLAAAAVLGACGDRTAPAGGGGAPDEVAYAPELEVDLAAMERTGSGLYRQDVVPGSGEEATAGRVVTVHYSGWLPDGTEFDSSRGSAPFEFNLGAGDVIPGWEEGVEGMRVGGTRKLVIPSELAYGDMGAGGVIPPGATLVFEVELLDVR